jgi:hypothetical protein
VSKFIALMVEAARTSETLVNFYQTARRYNPEDSYLRKWCICHDDLSWLLAWSVSDHVLL